MTIPRSRVNRTTLIRQLFTGLLRVSGLPEGDVDKPSDLLPCLRVRSPPHPDINTRCRRKQNSPHVSRSCQ